MSSSFARYRLKLKKENPAKYEEFLEKDRLRCQQVRDARKKKLEEKRLTREEVVALEKKRDAKRQLEKERYMRIKAEKPRQTLKNIKEASRNKKSSKRRKDMTEEECRKYDNAVRQRQRDARTPQKRNADLMRRRRQYQMKKEKENNSVTPVKQSRPKKSSKLPITAHILDPKLKIELDLSNEQYVQAALNMINFKKTTKRKKMAEKDIGVGAGDDASGKAFTNSNPDDMEDNSETFAFSSNTSLEDLRKLNESFIKERNWHQFHSPRNVLLALVGEVGELAEIFQWKGEVSEGLPELTEQEREHVGQEMSDVLIYLLDLAVRCKIDLPVAVAKKMAANAKKYPVDKAYGKANKYTDYQE